MKDLLLILASICFIIIFGAAVYEHIAVIPAWSSGPPVSLHIFQGEHAIKAANFWMMIHPVTLLLMIGALMVNWNTARRRNLLIVLISYALILAVTAIYFVPTLMGFMGEPYSDTVNEALTSKAKMWEMLSLVRLVFIAFLAYTLLKTLTISNAITREVVTP
jgi:hypothetical protein